MSDYHLFQCDRCQTAVKASCKLEGEAPSIPQYWVRLHVQTKDARLGDFTNSTKDLCGSCYSLVERLIRNKDLQLIHSEAAADLRRRAETPKEQ